MLCELERETVQPVAGSVREGWWWAGGGGGRDGQGNFLEEAK